MNKNGSNLLSRGAIKEIAALEGDKNKQITIDYTLQVITTRKKEDGKVPGTGPQIFTSTMSDGEYKYTGFVLFAEANQSDLKPGDIIRAYSISISTVNSTKSKIFVIKKFDLVEKAAEIIGSPELLKDDNSSKERPSVNNTINPNINSNGVIMTNRVSNQQTNPSSGWNNNYNNNNNNNKSNNYSTLNDNNNYSRQSNQGDDQRAKKFYHPLASLTTFTKDIQILVRVLKKTEKKNFSNRNTGNLFSFTVIDADGTEMQATCFNKACDKFFDIITENEIFEIVGGYVKINDKKFSSVKSDYKLILEENTKIEHKEDDGSINSASFNFIKISDVGPLQVHTMVDIFAYVIEANETSTKTTKLGNAEIRKLVLVDDSSYRIEFTLWKGHAMDSKIQKGTVISVKNAKVGDFNGRSLSTVDDTMIMVNPEVENTKELKIFVEKDLNREWISFSNGTGGAGGNSDAISNSPIITIKEALAILDSGVPDDGIGACKIKGTICTINHTDKNFYAGCPDKTCKKKMVPDTYSWLCNGCTKTHAKPTYYYTLSFRIKDASTEHWVDIFGDIGAKLFKINCEEYKDLVNGHDEVRLKEINASLEFKTFFFTCKPKLQIYNNIPKKKLNIWRVDALDVVNDAKRLTKNLKTLLNIKN